MTYSLYLNEKSKFSCIISKPKEPIQSVGAVSISEKSFINLQDVFVISVYSPAHCKAIKPIQEMLPQV